MYFVVHCRKEKISRKRTLKERKGINADAVVFLPLWVCVCVYVSVKKATKSLTRYSAELFLFLSLCSLKSEYVSQCVLFL